MPNQRYTLHVNGTARTVEAEPGTPLLHLLRDDLALDGPLFGCGLGQCGACTVLIDGDAYRSCIQPVERIGARPIVTVEGLLERNRPGRVQQAFIDEQAAQCGYCTAGMVVSATALLRKTPQPTDAQIRTALEGNLCRCGTQQRVVRAVKRAAGESA